MGFADKAMKKMKSNESPGENGLPPEAFKMLQKGEFWSSLGAHCRRTIKDTGTMLVSLESCVSLVFKSYNHFFLSKQAWMH